MATSLLQSLNCPICYELLDNQKILDCAHTFCVNCLTSTLEGNKIKCPICRKVTLVDNGNISSLRTNVVLSSLLDDIKKPKRCNAKNDPSHQEIAILFCQECNSYLCTECFEIHSQWQPNRRHTTVSVEEHRQQILPIPTVSVSASTDKEHHDKLVCVNCNKYVSSTSAKDRGHKLRNHKIITETEYASNTRSRAARLQSEVTKTLTKIRTISTSYANFEQEVRSFSCNLISVINDACSAKERELQKWKLKLVTYCQTLQESASKRYHECELNTASDRRSLVELSNLVGSSLEESHNIPAFAEICDNLSRLLTTINAKARDTQLEEMITVAGSMDFQDNPADYGALTTTTWQPKATHDLRSDRNMTAVDTDKEGRIAIGYFEGGVEIIENREAEMLNSRTVLEDTRVLGLAFSRDGCLVVCDENNGVQLFSAEMELMNNAYRTLTHEEGGDGCLAVDGDDNIYVSYRSVKKIHIFARKGGKAFREIDCLTYTPQQIEVTSKQKILVMDGNVITMFPNAGPSSTQIMYLGCHGYPCVSSDGSVLVAWVDRANSLLRIDRYSEDFKLVKCIYSSSTIDLSGRAWYFLRELSRGHLAFCTIKKWTVLKKELEEMN